MQGITTYQENEIITNQFIIEHTSLVKKIALHMKRRLPSHIELDDLMQSGYIGLLEAKQNYKDNMGTSFDTFASIRIRGAIIDSLRKTSWCNRTVTKNMRLINEVISKLEQRHQKSPTSEEIANEMGVDIDEYQKICQQISLSNVLNIDMINEEETLSFDSKVTPLESTEREEMLAMIKGILTTLPEREQLVLSLYYVDEFTFKQIAEILDLTEARICQLHSQAIAKIQIKVDLDKD